MMILFVILGVSIVVPAATIAVQDANAASNDNSNYCSHQKSDSSDKCSQKDAPFILPFP
jgi:hypothetical protein